MSCSEWGSRARSLYYRADIEIPAFDSFRAATTCPPETNSLS